jgi:hypothetical protein
MNSFSIFALNVVTIYLALKDVNVWCDDKVVKLSNIVIVSFCPFTLIVECIVVSMFKDLLFDVCWSVFHWDMIYELFWDYNPIKCHCLCKGNDLILREWISTCDCKMYVVWGWVHLIVWLFVIDAFLWQHFDQFEFFSFAKVEQGKDFFFLNTKKCYICQTMFIDISRVKSQIIKRQSLHSMYVHGVTNWIVLKIAFLL